MKKEALVAVILSTMVTVILLVIINLSHDLDMVKVQCNEKNAIMQESQVGIRRS